MSELHLDSAKDYRRAVSGANQRFSKWLSHLEESCIAGNTDEIEPITKRILSSPRSKLAAFDFLARRGRIGIPSDYPAVKGLIENIDLFSPQTEPVRVHAKQKTSKNGFRAICEFGPEHRIAQRMASAVLGIHHRPKPFQKSDRGVPKAIQEILTRIDSGQVWLAHCDIRRFFPSFTGKGLKSFCPLPNEVVEGVLIGRSMVFDVSSSLHYSLDVITEEARLGLPQGASSSPVVAHMVVSRLSASAETLEQLFNYEDDFLVLASTKAELNNRVAELKDAVEQLPGGQFILYVKPIAHADDGSDFLGHRIVRADGKAIAKPTEANFEVLHKKLEFLTPVNGTTAKSIASQIAVVAGWINAFSACDTVTEEWKYLTCIPADLLQTASDNGIPAEMIKEAGANGNLGEQGPYYYRWFEN